MPEVATVSPSMRRQRELPSNPENDAAAHFARGQAAQARAEWQRAHDAYGEALKLRAEEPEYLYAAADLLLEQAHDDSVALERARELAVRGGQVAEARSDGELRYAFAVLEAEARRELGDSRGALAVLDRALEQSATGFEARLERAAALMELCRFDEAEKAFRVLAKESPTEAWPAHALGLLAERRGETEAATELLRRAHALDAEGFPLAVEMEDGEFDAVVQDALARLPPEARAALERAVLAVEPFPSDEDLRAADPPFSPNLLGLFSGVATVMGGASPEGLPPRIVLYQRNLERAARTRDDLVEQIRITVQHEVGHLLGLDEDDLLERGLD